MKSKLYIVFIVFVAFSFKGFAKGLKESGKSQISVVGIVIDNKTGEALVGVKVKLTGCEDEVYTNFEGKFEFTNLTPGDYSLVCNMVAYEQFSINTLKIDVTDGQNALVLRLNPVAIKFRPKQKYEPIMCG